MKALNNTARGWLTKNGYEDVAKLIEETMLEWKVTGNKQRRNWWAVLAGDKYGNPRKIAGREFPVLRIARLRQGLNDIDESIQRSEKEENFFPIKITRRWQNHENGKCQ